MLKMLRAWGRGTAVPHKKDTAEMPTQVMPLPQRVVLPMQQHIGAPCVPAVAKGDAVNVGQVVGRAQGFVSADIHSGVSGTVEEVLTLTTPTGSLVPAVVIKPDGQQTVDPSVTPPAVRDRESFIAAVRACGLVGLGGAGFPTHVKMSPKNPEAIDTLIINAAECEPNITSDTREMLECGDSVISGIVAAQKYLEIPRAYIAIERNKPEAIDLMFSLTRGDDKMTVYPLESRYPQGAEKVLIETVTGREVPDGGLPADVGVLVLNVATVSAIGRYLAGGLPLMTRRLTVDGSVVARPGNVEVPIGTPLADVLDFCGGFTQPPAKVIVGGPMMGVAMDDLGFPVIKQNNAIVAYSAAEASLPEPSPCIRCGRCILACPVRLSPTEIEEAYDARDIEALRKLSASVCMGCGVCSYVCPAKRLLSPACTLARILVLKEAKK